MNWIRDQETSVEQIAPCLLFCEDDLISTSYIMDTTFSTGNTPHLIYFWLQKMNRFWSTKSDRFKYALLLFIPLSLYIVSFGLAAASLSLGMLITLFVACLMIFMVQGVPLIPAPLFSSYMVGRHHKWNSMGSIVFGFFIFSIVMYSLVFILEFYTASMNSRTNQRAALGSETFASQYLSIVAIGVPFVAVMALAVHETYNDVPNFFPVNPVYYIHGKPTPLTLVREVIDRLKHDVDDTSYTKALMEKFFHAGGGHYYNRRHIH